MDELKTNAPGLIGLGPRRRAAGYTQATFAQKLGIERGRYSMWESCAIWPSAQWLPKMARLLGCGVEDLYEAPGDMTAEPCSNCKAERLE